MVTVSYRNAMAHVENSQFKNMLLLTMNVVRPVVHIIIPFVRSTHEGSNQQLRIWTLISKVGPVAGARVRWAGAAAVVRAKRKVLAETDDETSTPVRTVISQQIV